MWNDFIRLLFPETCVTCGVSLFFNEKSICTFCLQQLPKTNFHKLYDNPVKKVFEGRVIVEKAFSYLFFKKGSKTQQILHQLKYKNKEILGIELGMMYGKDLISDGKNNFDLILPVPLHPTKMAKRGYNQSAAFARGMANTLSINMDEKNVIRIKNTETQTKKSRLERWLNVSEVFKVNNPTKLQNKHVLIVDDVITTGATIEAMAKTLHAAGCSKISIASIACA